MSRSSIGCLLCFLTVKLLLAITTPSLFGQEGNKAVRGQLPEVPGLGTALVIDHSTLVDSKAKPLSDLESSIRQLGFPVTRISALSRDKCLEELKSFARRVPTRSFVLVYYRGPMVLGEKKIQSKYYDAPYMIPAGFEFKNKKEVRSRCVGLHEIEGLIRQSGCGYYAILADQLPFATKNAEFSDLQKKAELKELKTDSQVTPPISFIALQRNQKTSVSQLIQTFDMKRDSTSLVQLLSQIKNQARSLGEPGKLFLRHRIQFVDWKYFDDRVSEGKSAGSVRVNSVGQVFCWVPPGKFIMGSISTEKYRNEDEAEVEVEINKGYWISKYEVTEREYFDVTNRRPRKSIGNAYPYTNSRHGDAKRYADNLGKREKDQLAGWVYSLPKETEWEYACRAGTRSPFHFGEALSRLTEFGNFADSSLYSKDPSVFRYAEKSLNDGFAMAAPVGSFLPNAWGIHDMHGNVWEWCAESYRTVPYSVQTKPESKPFNDLGRVVRGGSWLSYPHYCRSAMRNAQPDLNDAAHIGFRIVVKQN